MEDIGVLLWVSTTMLISSFGALYIAKSSSNTVFELNEELRESYSNTYERLKNMYEGFYAQDKKTIELLLKHNRKLELKNLALRQQVKQLNKKESK